MLALAPLAAAAVAGAIVPRAIRPQPNAETPCLAVLEQARARRESQLARDPDNHPLRLRLALSLLQEGEVRAHESVEAASLSPPQLSDDLALRLQERAIMERSPEFAAARDQIRWVLHCSTEPPVRSLAWKMLAIMAARLGDTEEQQSCLAASEHARGVFSPNGARPFPGSRYAWDRMGVWAYGRSITPTRPYAHTPTR
jgi:hypothetical protein